MNTTNLLVAVFVRLISYCSSTLLRQLTATSVSYTHLSKYVMYMSSFVSDFNKVYDKFRFPLRWMMRYQ